VLFVTTTRRVSRRPPVKRPQRTVTERQDVSLSEFEAEIQALEAGGESKNFLIYGDSNCGKTRLAGTVPGKAFWLVGEPGYKSAARAGATGHSRVIANTATALAAVDWLNYKRRYERLDWLILDGLSTMEKRFRLTYAQEAFDTKGSRTHRNLPDKPDYFNTQNFLLSWIPMLVDMPVNLLITAHPYRTDRTDNGELLVFPGIQGKIAEVSNAISGLMDVVGYMEKRRVRTRAGSKIRRTVYFETPERGKEEEEIRYVCGDKFGVLPDRIDNPSMQTILGIIDGDS
jgi:hypothetical protein